MALTHTRTGLLFILIAPAGAGKNALMNLVLKHTDGLRQLPTATTRAMRDGEQQGREHLFVTNIEFRQMIDDNALLEWQEVHGRLYGVPRATVETALAEEDDLIADIEFKGATILREQYPENTVAIFIHPPSVSTLIERMRLRGESEAAIGRRMMRMPQEMAYVNHCDYLIYNHDIDTAAAELRGIVLAEKCRRNIRKLRDHSAPPLIDFTYASEIIPTYETEVLCRENPPHFPSTQLNPGEQPYAAALRALRETLSIDAPVEGLVSLVPADDDFIPPVHVNCACDSGGECVLMYYLYRMAERIAPPPGWAWQPLEHAALPETIQHLLVRPAE